MDSDKRHRDLMCFYILQIGEHVKQFDPFFSDLSNLGNSDSQIAI